MTTATRTGVTGEETLHHVVAPGSVRVWFSSFCSTPADAVHHVGEDGPLDGSGDLSAVLAELPADPAVRYVLHSGHRSLHRDVRLAELLQARGHHVLAQSYDAAVLGTDKRAMKRFFAAAAVPTPEAPGAADDPGPWVVKQRDGTEGRGMRLVHGTAPAGDDDTYVERFVPGEEYSVVAYSDEDRIVTFPVVGKGPSTPDLVPPWRRERACPAPGLDPAAEQTMLEITERIVADAKSRVWLEVEFVVCPERGPLVLEINPRVAGTMRLAAMTAGVALYDLPVQPDVRGALPARRHGLEVPWSADPVIDPERQVFATSRLTVAAATPAAARARIEALQQPLGVR